MQYIMNDSLIKQMFLSENKVEVETVEYSNILMQPLPHVPIQDALTKEDKYSVETGRIAAEHLAIEMIF
jgi:hypothetical protein